MAKDDSSTTSHSSAVSMATAQSEHEWCRLVHSIREGKGDKGVEILFQKWVQDRERAECNKWKGTYHIEWIPGSHQPKIIDKGEFMFSIKDASNDNIADLGAKTQIGVEEKPMIIVGRGSGTVEDIDCGKKVVYNESFLISGNYDPKTKKASMEVSNVSPEDYVVDGDCHTGGNLVRYNSPANTEEFGPDIYPFKIDLSKPLSTTEGIFPSKYYPATQKYYVKKTVEKSETLTGESELITVPDTEPEIPDRFASTPPSLPPSPPVFDGVWECEAGIRIDC